MHLHTGLSLLRKPSGQICHYTGIEAHALFWLQIQLCSPLIFVPVYILST